MTIVDRARGDRGAREGDRADAAAASGRAARCTRSRCPGTGASAGCPAATPPTTSCVLVRRPERLDPGGQGVHLRRPGGPPDGAGTARLAGAPRGDVAPNRGRPGGRAAQDAGHMSTSATDDRDRHPPPGRAAHGLLHRHDGVHRLQGLRGRLQAVERPARRRRRSSGKGGSYDHTGELSASTWRHVRFVELFEPSPQLKQEAERRSAPAPAGSAGNPRRRIDLVGAARTRRASSTSPRRWQDGRLGVHVRRLQALHQRRLPRRLPDRRADPHRVRDRGAAAGRLQRLRLLHAGMPVRRRRPRPRGRPRRQMHALLRPPRGRAGARLREVVPDRLDPVRPHEELVEVASRRVAELHLRGIEGAYCTARATSPTSSSPAGSARSSC